MTPKQAAAAWTWCASRIEDEDMDEWVLSEAEIEAVDSVCAEMHSQARRLLAEEALAVGVHGDLVTPLASTATA